MKKLILSISLLSVFLVGFGQIKTKNELLTDAATINNATAPGTNTAARIGAMFENIIKTIPLATSTAGEDAYTTSYNSLTSYGTNYYYIVKFVIPNTGPATINFNSLGAKNILHNDGSSLSAGDLEENSYHWLIYDGTQFKLMDGPGTSGGGGTWGTITGTFTDQTDAVTYIDGKVANSITNGVTTSAPNQDQVFDALALKQDALVSGTNIKTVNSNSLVGSGNVAVGDALVANPLSQFASTTSSQLAGVISDETGSGSLVFGTSPSFTAPNIGSATGSITGNAGTATALQTPRNINGTAFDGTGNITVTAAAGTLTGTTLNNTVVSSSLTSVGTIGTGVWNGTSILDAYIASATTWNAKQSAITFGTGSQTALGVNVGSAGAFVVNGGALGTPSSGVATNLTGTASGLTAGNVTTNANLSGDVTSSGNTTTLATVNSNTGSFGSATQVGTFTVNGKGLITAAGNTTVTPALSSVTGLGSNVGAALATPTSANFDAAITGPTGWKQPVKAATTTNGTLATSYENADVLDGITLVTGDRILLKNQTTGSENGIYLVNASGAPTRAGDADGTGDLEGCIVEIQQGTVNRNSIYHMITDAVTIGTTAQVWISNTTYVTPEMFGALGDGTTDDATAIQAAVDSGFPVFFGQKNYKVGTTITLSSNARIYGSGQASKISTAANISIVTIGGINTSIENLAFVGSGTGSSQHGINATGVGAFTTYRYSNQVANCIFNNLGNAGIYTINTIGSSSGTNHEGTFYVTNCQAYSCSVGFLMDTRGEYNLFSNCSAHFCVAGFRCYGGNNTFTGGDLSDNSIGLSILNGTNSGKVVVAGTIISHNTTNISANTNSSYCVLSGLSVGSGLVTLISAVDLKFYGCTFNALTTVTTTSCTGTEFNDCNFPVNPTITVTGALPRFFNCNFTAGTPPIQAINTLNAGLVIDADISPTALSANTDNYAPTNIETAHTLRISASSAIDLTGINGGITMVDGRELVLINVGTTNTITLKSDVASTAAYRFLLPADFSLGPNMAARLIYDGTSGRWRKAY